MTYTETITHHGEAAVTCTISDADALSALRRGQRYRATVTADQNGVVTITRTRLVLDGDDVAERKTVVVLRPDTKPARLTKTQYDDLKRIQSAGDGARLLPEGRIAARFYRIPPAATKRLLDRGLVVTTREGCVEIGVAGLLAMAAYEHPARTTAPRGWHHPTGVCINTTRNHRAHPYQVLDRTSTAVCRCGGLLHTYDGREYAAAAVRNHLAEQFSAVLTGV